jgi:hypothetical protein
MPQSLGRGFFGSLRSQVEHEICALSRENSLLRQARYSFPRRVLGGLLVGRSISQFLALYGPLLVIVLVFQWLGNRYFPSRLPGYIGSLPRDFLKDIGSYLIAAQIGILAIVSVAVGVVALLQAETTVLLSIRTYGCITSSPIRMSSPLAAWPSS